jgi:hypothetical protein
VRLGRGDVRLAVTPFVAGDRRGVDVTLLRR